MLRNALLQPVVFGAWNTSSASISTEKAYWMREWGISAVIRVVPAIALFVLGGRGVRASLPLKYYEKKIFFADHFLWMCIDAEALHMTYDPEQLTYNTLLQFFYKMHDPTTKDRQGMDSGTQYRSAIFYHSSEQKKEAEEVTRKANEQWYKGKISTEVLEAGQWWDAEEYHQLYLERNPGGYECPAHYVRNLPDLN